MTNKNVVWRVEEQDTGLEVAKGIASTADEAGREMMHYAMQYAQDGAVRFSMRQGRKTLVRGKVDGVMVTARSFGNRDLRELLPNTQGSVA